MEPNLSRPKSIGNVDPSVFEELLSRFPNTQKSAIQFPGMFTKVPKDNYEVLDVIGDFKDVAVDYAQETLKRRVKRVHYIVDTTDFHPGKQHRTGSYHSEYSPGGTSLLTASVHPTVFIAQKNPTVDAEPYLESAYYPFSYSYDFATDKIMQGLDDGVFEKYQPLPGEVVELEGHIHRSPGNMTGEVVKRVFLACDIKFKKF